MIQIIEKPYPITRREVDSQFTNKLVVLEYNSDSVDSGLLVAHSDGNKATENEDRRALLRILWDNCKGNGKLVSGYLHNGSELVCI